MCLFILLNRSNKQSNMKQYVHLENTEYQRTDDSFTSIYKHRDEVLK